MARPPLADLTPREREVLALTLAHLPPVSTAPAPQPDSLAVN